MWINFTENYNSRFPNIFAGFEAVPITVQASGLQKSSSAPGAQYPPSECNSSKLCTGCFCTNITFNSSMRMREEFRHN